MRDDLPRTPEPPLPELVTREGEALRRLARVLVRDEHGAEDVVQDAWLAAHRRSGATVRLPAAWLRTLVRRVASNRARSEHRRAAREARAARPEACDEAAGRGRAETLAAVTQAVLALDEPYRRTVLARWFEGRPPRAIAAQEGVPVATVKARLTRAHATLRRTLAARLEPDERGDWRARCCLLAGLRPPASAHAPPPTVAPVTALASSASFLLMSLKTPLVASALLVAALGTFLLMDADGEGVRPRSGPPRAAVPAPELVLEAGPEALAPATSAGERRAEAVADAAPPESPREHVLHLRGVVRAASGLPTEGARVLLAPPDGTFCEAATTDAAGRFEVRVAARTPVLDALLAVRAGGGSVAPRFVQLGRDAFDVDLTLVPTTRVSPGAQSLRISLQPDLVASGVVSLRVVEHVPQLDGALPMTAGPDGVLRFWASNSLATCPGRTGSEHAARVTNFFAADLTATGSFGLVDLADGSAVLDLASAGEPAWVEGRLLDADGGALAGMLVAATEPLVPAPLARPRPGRVLATTATDADGAFVLHDLRPGPLLLVACAGAAGGAEELVDLAPGAGRGWNPLLSRERFVAGRLLGPDGAPLSGWSIELTTRAASSLAVRATTTDDAGRFALTRLDAGSATLTAAPPLPADAVPLVLRAGAGAEGELGELSVGTAALARATLELTPLLAGEPEAVALVSGRLEDRSTGRAVLLQADPETGRLRAPEVPPGSYRLVLAAPAGGATTRELVVEAGGVVDLGAVGLEEPSWLEVEDEAPSRGELELWRLAPDVLARRPLVAGGVQAHGPGRYRATGGDAALELELRPSEHVTLRRSETGALSVVETPVRERSAADLRAAACATCHVQSPPAPGLESLEPPDAVTVDHLGPAR